MPTWPGHRQGGRCPTWDATVADTQRRSAHIAWPAAGRTMTHLGRHSGGHSKKRPHGQASGRANDAPLGSPQWRTPSKLRTIRSPRPRLSGRLRHRLPENIPNIPPSAKYTHTFWLALRPWDLSTQKGYFFGRTRRTALFFLVTPECDLSCSNAFFVLALRFNMFPTAAPLPLRLTIEV